MPYKFYDYIPGRVIYMSVWGNYTHSENIASNKESIAILDAAINPIISIVDFTLMDSFSKNLNVLSSSFNMFAHPNHHWQLVITDDRLTAFISATVIQVAKRGNRPQNFAIVKTQSEALTRLKRIDPNLTDIPPLPPFEAIT
ncbi:MAG: hypothetical protein ACOYL5_01945 [Phototrophicaceae bacterium]